MDPSRIWGRGAAVLLAAGMAVLGSAAAQQPAKSPASPDKIPVPRPAIGVEPATPSILQPGENPIDLGNALRLAGVENPELLLARARTSEVAAVRQLAAAQLLPNLNFGISYDAHTGVLQQSTGDILSVNRSSAYYGLGASAVGAGTVNVPGLNYNLNVGDAWFGYLTSRQRVRTAVAAADAVRNDVLLRVCLAYTDLLRGDGRRAIAAKNRGEAAEIARLTTVFAEKGQGRKADADRAAVELRKRDAEVAQAEADTLTASARLAQLLNLDPSTRLKPIDGWVVPAPAVPDPIPLAELIAIALLGRPELAARRSEVRTSLYELSSAKVLPFAPNVILGFSAGGFGGGSNLVSTSPGFIGGNGQLQTGPRFGDFDGRNDFDVALFWTLRNLGVGNVALVRAADSRVKQTRLRELETLNTVRAEVAEAKAKVDARVLQIEAAEKAVKSGGAAYVEDLKRIQQGEGLPLELVDSFRIVARSRIEYLDAIIDYNRAQFQLWVSLGRPPANVLARPVPADLVPPPAVPLIEVKPGPFVMPIPRVLPAPLPARP